MDIIVQWVSVASCWQDPFRSLDKAAQAVRKEALSFLKAFDREGELRRTLQWLHQVMQSGVKRALMEAGEVPLSYLSREVTGI